MNEQIISKIKKLGQQAPPVYRAVVKTVDKFFNVCTVQLVSNPELIIEGVQLRAINNAGDLGFILYPAVNSFVLISQIEGLEDYVVISVSILDNETSILVNGGLNGGLIIIADLVSRLNVIEDRINYIQDNYNTHAHVANGSPPSSLLSVPNLQQTVINDIENPKIKH